MPRDKDLNHFLQLRLKKQTVAAIDDAIATVPQLCGFSRCKFIRASVSYTLASIEEEASTKQNEPGGQDQHEEKTN
jgi:hypothetical protein